MKLVLLALGAVICFGQSSIQIQTNGPMPGGPFPARLVTGRPFTAEAIIQTDQTLADGSHIVDRQTVAAARDSQGRTYREETFASPAMDHSPVKTIFISDPVAHANYVLGPDRVVRKIRMSAPGSQQSEISVSTGAPPQGDVALQRFRTAVGGGSGPVQAGPQSVRPVQPTAPSDTKVGQLGTRMIAGVEAEGTRATQIIPAGEVGNQSPFAIVTERWYSKDLEATVLASHSDPRLGTSSYELINVRRNEPPALLFAIPAGYTVEEEH
jgi:hypothetical protein